MAQAITLTTPDGFSILVGVAQIARITDGASYRKVVFSNGSSEVVTETLAEIQTAIDA